MINLLRQLWDRVTLYLPVFLMGALAMATYWLVRSTPIVARPRPATAAQHKPDYFMRNFAVKTFDAAGKLKSEVKGTEARHYPDTNMLEIESVQIRSFDVQGRLTTASARLAITNEDASEVQLIGTAQVMRAPVAGPAGVAEPALTFAGEYLYAFIHAERVISNKPVELTRGQDRFTADNMDFDNLQRVMLLKGRVKGILLPAARP